MEARNFKRSIKTDNDYSVGLILKEKYVSKSNGVELTDAAVKTLQGIGVGVESVADKKLISTLRIYRYGSTFLELGEESISDLITTLKNITEGRGVEERVATALTGLRASNLKFVKKPVLTKKIKILIEDKVFDISASDINVKFLRQLPAEVLISEHYLSNLSGYTVNSFRAGGCKIGCTTFNKALISEFVLKIEEMMREFENYKQEELLSTK
jgi:hypothetical protein